MNEPKRSLKRPTSISPMEFVNRYDRATQLRLGSGPISALIKDRTGAARPKPPTPQPKLAPMANTGDLLGTIYQVGDARA